MNRIKITERISYIKASENPLSADVGIIEGDSCCWLFDVGADSSAAEEINALPKPKKAVISHFHPDHTGNLDKIELAELYVGANTFKYTKKGTVVDRSLIIKDGVDLQLFPLPSSHAKGSLGLLVGDYAFLGDGTYATAKQGRACYNASVLKEEIDVLSAVPAKYFLISHDEVFVKTKDEIIKQLKEVYSRRDPKESYIFL